MEKKVYLNVFYLFQCALIADRSLFLYSPNVSNFLTLPLT